MSHALKFAAIQPLMIAAPAAVAVLLIIVVAIARKQRRKKAAAAAWASAADELGIELVTNGSDLGPLARGRVNDHVVSIAPIVGNGRKAGRCTQYSVKFEATEAPQFRLIKRINAEFPTLDTGNPKFDAVVAIQTEQPVMLARFLTPSRRAGILRILTYWPEALISNREVHLTTAGIETDENALVEGICHLVATAETFDRPASRPEHAIAAAVPAATAEVALAPEPTVPVPAAHETPAATAVVEEPASSVAPIEPAPVEVAAAASPVGAAPAAVAVAEADVLTEVRLDERTVLEDLFNDGLTPDQIAARFEQIYRGREINWTGEVVRVGPPDEIGSQRIAALIGSADGQHPDSGRVVALTSAAREQLVTQGDVVSVSGLLVNLDASQRLFHVF